MSRTTPGGILAQLGLLGVALMTTILAASSQSQPDARLFEGSRLIVGDGSSIENSAFVVENRKITKVVEEGEVRLPAGRGSYRPGRQDGHAHAGERSALHLGYEGYTSWSGENYTRDNVVNHLARLAYYGVGAVISTGTDPTRVRPRAAAESASQERLAEPGIYSPPERRRPAVVQMAASSTSSSSAVENRRIYDLPDETEARKVAGQLGAKSVKFIKIWVDDRNGGQPKLQPNVYGAFIDEAHKHHVKVVAHPQNARDSKELLEAGIDGLLHLRTGPELDDEAVRLIEDFATSS